MGSSTSELRVKEMVRICLWRSRSFAQVKSSLWLGSIGFIATGMLYKKKLQSWDEWPTVVNFHCKGTKLIKLGILFGPGKNLLASCCSVPLKNPFIKWICYCVHQGYMPVPHHLRCLWMLSSDIVLNVMLYKSIIALSKLIMVSSLLCLQQGTDCTFVSIVSDNVVEGDLVDKWLVLHIGLVSNIDPYGVWLLGSWRIKVKQQRRLSFSLVDWDGKRKMLSSHNSHNFLFSVLINLMNNLFPKF